MRSHVQTKAPLALLSFPGSNCEADCLTVLCEHYHLRVQVYPHTTSTLPRQVRGVIVPGGFSYGDYLRAGALAAHTPLSHTLRTFAARGGAIIGICNGFQILTELSLLPGTLLPNHSRAFIARTVRLTADNSRWQLHGELSMPIAHAQGCYYHPNPRQLEDNDQIVLRYANNPNGSQASIAAVCSATQKIIGLMPHPERAWHPLLGCSTDGLQVWDAFLAACL